MTLQYNVKHCIRGQQDAGRVQSLTQKRKNRNAKKSNKYNDSIFWNSE